MTATPGLNPVCRWCGMHHGVRCPFVAAIEYEGDGVTVKRVEFFGPSDSSVTRRCPQCDVAFQAGGGAGRRRDARFCSDEHRVAYNSLHRGSESW